MNELLDIVWLKIVAVTQDVVNVMDVIVSPRHALGPGMVILMLVLLTVVWCIAVFGHHMAQACPLCVLFCAAS